MSLHICAERSCCCPRLRSRSGPGVPLSRGTAMTSRVLEFLAVRFLLLFSSEKECDSLGDSRRQLLPSLFFFFVCLDIVVVKNDHIFSLTPFRVFKRLLFGTSNINFLTVCLVMLPPSTLWPFMAIEARSSCAKKRTTTKGASRKRRKNLVTDITEAEQTGNSRTHSIYTRQCVLVLLLLFINSKYYTHVLRKTSAARLDWPSA